MVIRGGQNIRPDPIRPDPIRKPNRVEKKNLANTNHRIQNTNTHSHEYTTQSLNQTISNSLTHRIHNLQIIHHRLHSVI